MSTPEFPPPRRRLVVSFDDEPASPSLAKSAAAASPLAPPPAAPAPRPRPAPAPPAPAAFSGLPPVPAPRPPVQIDGGFPPPPPPPGAGASFGTPPPPPLGAMQPGTAGPAAAGRPLGSRGARFLSRFVDGLIFFPIWVVFYGAASLLSLGIFASGVANCGYDDYGDYACSDDAFAAAGAGAIVAFFAVFLLTLAIVLGITAALTVRGGERNGQTLGRQVVSVRLVRVDGRPVDWGTALKRELLFPILLAVPFFLGTLADRFWPFIDSRKRRLVDIWCDTEVLISHGTAPVSAPLNQPPAPYGVPAGNMPPPPGPFGGVR